MPQISIIVPVYNVENYLRQCVDSILAQTFTDFELILVDDGSSDKCSAICDEYAKRDERIKVIHKQNAGVSAARNDGIKIASGEYIAFCDSDDYYINNHLYCLYNAAVLNNADCVVANYNTINESREILKSSNRAENTFDLSIKSDTFNFLLKEILGYSLGWEVWTRLFKTSIIKEKHIEFPTTCNNYAEDLAFVLAYSSFAKRIICIKECTYCYLLRDNSMMRKSEKTLKLDEINEVSYHYSKIYSNVFQKTKYLTKYHVVHFLIMYIEFGKIINSENYQYLPRYLNSLKKLNFSLKMYRRNKHDFFFLSSLYGKQIAIKMALFSHFCIHRNWKRFGYESAFTYRFLINGDKHGSNQHHSSSI